MRAGFSTGPMPAYLQPHPNNDAYKGCAEGTAIELTKVENRATVVSMPCIARKACSWVTVPNSFDPFRPRGEGSGNVSPSQLDSDSVSLA